MKRWFVVLIALLPLDLSSQSVVLTRLDPARWTIDTTSIRSFYEYTLRSEAAFKEVPLLRLNLSRSDSIISVLASDTATWSTRYSKLATLYQKTKKNLDDTQPLLHPPFWVRLRSNLRLVSGTALVSLVVGYVLHP